MNREELLQSPEFEILKSRFSWSEKNFRLGFLDFSPWSTIQNQIGFAILQMTNGKVTMEDVMPDLTEYTAPQRIMAEPYSESNWKWKDVQVGDKFTTEGLRSFSSGGDAYDVWEEVVKVDNEKIFLKGFKSKSDWWSAIWGDHNIQYYTLCRYQKIQK